LEKIGLSSGIQEVTNPWVIENVLPKLYGLKNVSDRKTMRQLFWDFWIKYRNDSVCVVDCGYPVEAELLRKCVNDDNDERTFLGPYPLFDLATLLFVKGIDPLTDRIAFSGYNGNRHNPLEDALISGYCWIKAFNM
jgi:hypothetical protein